MRLFRVMDFVEENAPTTAAAGASAAAGGIAMSPSLPMTASSGTPPGIYNFFLAGMHDLVFFWLRQSKVFEKVSR